MDGFLCPMTWRQAGGVEKYHFSIPFLLKAATGIKEGCWQGCWIA
ncbi:hypothetical protein [Comamonas odontotermitis]